MPPVIRLTDQNNLVPTSKFPHGKFSFEKFNPVQSRVFEIHEEDCNVVVAAATSSGKTIASELIAAYELSRGGKMIYMAPLKALAKEKLDDWNSPEHHFFGKNIVICTGDFRLTASRKKELEEADIIVMTNEMLSSRVRHHESENNEFLLKTKVIICDEVHLLGAEIRGSHAEIGLMKFCQINPAARIVFLSATMPNVLQLAEWVSYSLTGKKTYLVESKYRPCPLGIHYETYQPQRYYEDTEAEKVNAALRIIEDNTDDKFIIFVHTKRTGEMMKQAAVKAGFETEFHNADLDKENRHTLEDRFKNGSLQVVVATSTIAQGVNLPARRVIVLGVHRGMSEVDPNDIIQEVGRAGRPGYDPRGDAYILLPEDDEQEYIDKIEKPKNIVSRLLDHVGAGDEARYKTLAFHLVGEIHHGAKTKDDIHKWYEKTLACFQAQDLHDSIVDCTLDSLLKCGAVKEENGCYKVTTVGLVASLFYYSPFDVADLKKNFKDVFFHELENNDLMVSLSLANLDSLRAGIVSKAEREEMSAYAANARRAFPGFSDVAIKFGFAYYQLMRGEVPAAMTGVCRNLQIDFPRLIQVVSAIDTMTAKWNKKDYFRRLQIRVMYGVRAELVDLCEVDDIGKVRSERLWAAGIHNPVDIVANEHRVAAVLNMSEERAAKICASAKSIVKENI